MSDDIEKQLNAVLIQIASLEHEASLQLPGSAKELDRLVQVRGALRQIAIAANRGQLILDGFTHDLVQRLHKG